MINKIVVLGGGSAGFISALSLKQRLPHLDVTVVRSKSIGIIGVGEGTTFTIPNFFHGYLGIDPSEFHRTVQPTYKLGIRFLWGPRERFHYSFTSQLDIRYTQLSKANGYFCRDAFDYADLTGAMMANGRCFEVQNDGGPLVNTNVAYHFENEPMVEFLEMFALRVGVKIYEGKVNRVECDDDGVKALHMESGESLSADFFVDCSGFRSELIGKTFEEPFIDYKSSLWCDKAVVGGWDRTDEPLYPFTTAETMDAGWCWQIEHDSWINRGYVYDSNFISDEEAEAELRRKNPKTGKTRIVPFTSGRYRNAWVKNVVAIGNAAGFVEPLEATALAIICDHASAVVRTLVDGNFEITPSQIKCFNEYNAVNWDCIRKFLALHYKFNTRIDSPFWRECMANVDLAGAEDIVEYYQENGPSLLWVKSLLDSTDPFGWEGYLAMLVGQDVPYDREFKPSDDEQAIWEALKDEMLRRASSAMKQEDALKIIRSESWGWRPDFYSSVSRW